MGVVGNKKADEFAMKVAQNMPLNPSTEPQRQRDRDD